MMRKIIPLLLPLLAFCAAQEPVAHFYTPHSVLGRVEKGPMYIESRPRYATCTDVRWFSGGTRLAVLNLLGKSLWICSWNGREIEPIESFSEADGLDLGGAEKLVFSSDESTLAISYRGGVAFYRVADNRIEWESKWTIRQEKGKIVHDAAFSPCGNYLATAEFDWDGIVCLYRKSEAGYEKVQSRPSLSTSMKAKGVVFSQKGPWILVGFCTPASAEIKPVSSAAIAVYKFDAASGTIGKKPISQRRWNGGVEAIVLSMDEGIVYGTDQAKDQIVQLSFDPLTGRLGKVQTALQNPASALSFPHGLSLSPDGRFLAVSNYGDDKVTVYELGDTP